jgi:transcriptional regulator of nitric oxide reductase
MNIILNYWPRVWQLVSFDSDLGSGRVRWLSRKPKQCAGWALKNNGSWCVIWSSGEHLVFQIGAKKWPVTDVYWCCNILQRDTRTFTILRKNEIVFELKYKAYDNDADQEIKGDRFI